MRIRVLAVAAVFGCASLAVSTAADPRADREKMVEAFEKMVKANKTVGKPIKGFAENPKLFVEIPDTPVGKVGNMVKVWAKLYDRGTRMPLDPPEYVSIAGYKWDRHEHFALCFESGVPVHLVLYNIKRMPDGSKTLQQVLPHDAVRGSKDLIPVGKTYEMPFDIRTENTPDDEEVQLMFVFAGDKERVEATGGDRPPSSFTTPPTTSDKKLAVFADGLLKEKVLARGVAIEPGAKTRSRTVEDVVSIVGINGQSGILEVTFQKKK